MAMQPPYTCVPSGLNERTAPIWCAFTRPHTPLPFTRPEGLWVWSCYHRPRRLSGEQQAGNEVCNEACNGVRGGIRGGVRSGLRGGIRGRVRGGVGTRRDTRCEARRVSGWVTRWVSQVMNGCDILTCSCVNSFWNITLTYWMCVVHATHTGSDGSLISGAKRSTLLVRYQA